MDTSDRVALPIQVHEFLLICAGRIDDDALTDARELLAVAELDRAVDLLMASLVAGRIPVTADERDRLRELAAAVRSSPVLVDRIIVDDLVPTPRHRFTTGAGDDPRPERGVGEAVGHVVEVLPDIRGISCVWRITPAGAPAGPVPQRVVLVQTGPEGFAPSTAYRVEQVLRRAGIRAAVEVLVAGMDLSDYHRDALAAASPVSLREAMPVRSGGPAEELFGDPPPRPVTSTRRRGAAHAEKRSAPESASGRWQQRIAAADGPPEDHRPTGPVERPMDRPMERPADRRVEPASTMIPPAEQPAPPPMPPPMPQPSANEQLATEPGVSRGRPPREVGRDMGTAGQSSMHSMAPVPPPAPKPEPAKQVESPSAKADPAADADLSNRERELLRQLHEELAKREQAEPEKPGAGMAEPPGRGWQVDRSAQRHSAFPAVDYGGGPWQPGAQDQTAVNGIPPYGNQPS